MKNRYLHFGKVTWAWGVRSLEQITGINRFMLQTRLDGKKGLFHQAFDAYLAEAEKVIYLSIASGDLNNLVQLFQKLFNDDKILMACHGFFEMNIKSDENDV